MKENLELHLVLYGLIELKYSVRKTAWPVSAMPQDLNRKYQVTQRQTTLPEPLLLTVKYDDVLRAFLLLVSERLSW